MRRRILILIAMMALTACAPEVGSEKWCEQLKDKPKGEWTSNEAGDFAKYCVLGIKPE
ncbi:MAG: DUF3012 domain-containing protein [Pseudomonadota bacterium]